MHQICILSYFQEETIEWLGKTILEKILAENFSELMKDIDPHITESKELLWFQCLGPPKFIFCNLIPKGDSIRSRAIGRKLGHEGSALMNKIYALIRKVWESFFAPSALWGYSEKK